MMFPITVIKFLFKALIILPLWPFIGWKAIMSGWKQGEQGELEEAVDSYNSGRANFKDFIAYCKGKKTRMSGVKLRKHA